MGQYVENHFQREFGETTTWNIIFSVDKVLALYDMAHCKGRI